MLHFYKTTYSSVLSLEIKISFFSYIGESVNFKILISFQVYGSGFFEKEFFSYHYSWLNTILWFKMCLFLSNPICSRSTKWTIDFTRQIFQFLWENRLKFIEIFGVTNLEPYFWNVLVEIGEMITTSFIFSCTMITGPPSME